MRCVKCGKELPDNLKFCTSCGAEIQKNEFNQLFGKDNLEKNGQATNTMNKGKILIPVIAVVLIVISGFMIWKSSFGSKRQMTSEEEKIEENTTSESVNESQNYITEESTNEYDVNNGNDAWKQGCIDLVDTLGDKISYRFVDVDNDGIPELSIASKENYYKAIYTYYDNKYVCVMDNDSSEGPMAGWVIGYIPQQNCIVGCALNHHEAIMGPIENGELGSFDGATNFDISSETVYLLGGYDKKQIIEMLDDYTGEESLSEDEKLMNSFIQGEVVANDMYGYSNISVVTEDYSALGEDEYPEDYYPEECFYPEYYKDLDNDGTFELVISNIYGQIYLDASNGVVSVFEDGTDYSERLSHIDYQGYTWIVKSDTSHSGREVHTFYRFNGAYNLEETFSLASYWNMEEEYYDQNSEFYIDNKQITMSEYKAKLNEIFGE